MANSLFQKATFAAGCFWGVEATFRDIEGVISTTVGYCGGQTDKPAYDEVCSGSTGHAEAVEVVFDPDKVTYGELLRAFWTCHDPTQLNRQGPDVGSQYRSAIFYHTSEQKAAATASKADLEQHDLIHDEVVTEILPASRFWPAEEYHQRYLEKHGLVSCRIRR